MTMPFRDIELKVLERMMRTYDGDLDDNEKNIISQCVRITLEEHIKYNMPKSTEKHGTFDKWHCKEHGEFERSIKFKSRPKCPKCKTVKLMYIGQVAR